jgi:hypothetical protein
VHRGHPDDDGHGALDRGARVPMHLTPRGFAPRGQHDLPLPAAPFGAPAVDARTQRLTPDRSAADRSRDVSLDVGLARAAGRRAPLEIDRCRVGVRSLRDARRGEQRSERDVASTHAPHVRRAISRLPVAHDEAEEARERDGLRAADDHPTDVARPDAHAADLG